MAAVKIQRVVNTLVLASELMHEIGYSQTGDELYVKAAQLAEKHNLMGYATPKGFGVFNYSLAIFTEKQRERWFARCRAGYGVTI